MTELVQGDPSEQPAREAQFSVRSMKPEEARIVARYHRDEIPTAFLSSLGIGFLSQLYKAITRSPHGFVFVAVDSKGDVCGFISGTVSVESMYRWVLTRRGWLLGILALPKALRWSTVRRLVQSLRYPSQIGSEYPDAELLSIAVAPRAWGTAAAGKLMNALLGEFRRRDCSSVKVVVGVELERANAYYVKHGFRLAGTISTHGDPSNVYVIDTEIQTGER